MGLVNILQSITGYCTSKKNEIGQKERKKILYPLYEQAISLNSSRRDEMKKIYGWVMTISNREAFSSQVETFKENYLKKH